MLETAADLAALDRLLQASIESAGPHLRKSFEMPSHSLNARQLVALFGRIKTLAFSTVTSRGEPRVTPTSVLFCHANIYVPSVADAARTRHLLRNPACSVAGFSENWALISHGSAALVDQADDLFPLLNEQMQSIGLSSVLEWGAGVFLRFDPRVMFTWSQDPQTGESVSATELYE
jgi:Pyridoxamine 5'-phosphate oxidase